MWRAKKNVRGLSVFSDIGWARYGDGRRAKILLSLSLQRAGKSRWHNRLWLVPEAAGKRNTLTKAGARRVLEPHFAKLLPGP